MDTLSRARPKELAHDYLEREPGSEQGLVSSLVVIQWDKERKADRDRPSPSSLDTNDLDAKQQAAAERSAARQQTERGDEHTNTRIPSEYPERELTPKQERGRDGPEDDL
jgi:hypothetical protein